MKATITNQSQRQQVVSFYDKTSMFLAISQKNHECWHVYCPVMIEKCFIIN